ncbi:DUF4097 and DUF4098 domain-containing protein YvlB [Thermosporothrix hazakensis]|jgi:hypothetical protein|uniref:DUF4097 and DUF4098 domain-containing protein YvlB n=1 Tax=Thermosporothrix hazakensis TaxID=644383 RepID=A0A326U457_THEHA|nr:hypothetical protein [Thermosporothrix hazakensis]PZW27423.1 DUF4097 and DUF4098 domain-containing protein YvlB [Thermosporothrix hazakensis]GCE45590.1 hypothetical protein KTH_04590 [Thermosporothrix hazakensis]
MSGQNAMFPQENISRQQNTDPREQRGTAYDACSEGVRLEPGAEQFHETLSMGEKVNPPQTSFWRWVIIAVVCIMVASFLWNILSAIFGSLLALLGIAAAFIGVSQLFVRAIPDEPRRFAVQERARLVLRNPVGSTRIRRGNVSEVEIKAVRYVNGWLGKDQEGAIEYTQEGDTIRVTVQSRYRWSPLGGLRNANFEIVVPDSSDLQIESNVGPITIEEVNGIFQLKTNTGPINVRRATLGSGSSLVTNVGPVEVRQANLTGNVNVRSDVGPVNFHGVLEPHGSYRFASSAGPVAVAVAGNPALQIKAKTDAGPINNQFGATEVGPAPRALLEVQTNLGPIDIRKG